MYMSDLKSINYDKFIQLVPILIVVAIFRYIFLKIQKDFYYFKDFSKKKSLSFFKSELPPIYPNSWIPVAFSSELKTNQIYETVLCGNDIILFRDENLSVVCFDAYCPHLGANLACGGSIYKFKNQNCIKCPFHGWSFNKNGECVDIPYNCSKDIPNGISIKKYHVEELNNFIYVWYHANNEEPTWSPETVNEILSKKWNFMGTTENIVTCHFQEIAENGADVAHLNEIHKTSVLNGSNISNLKWFSNLINKFNYHHWHAEYDIKDEIKNIADDSSNNNSKTQLCENQHIVKILMRQRTILFSFNLFEMNLNIRQVGPTMVYLRFKGSIFGYHITDGIFIQGIQPIEPLKHKVTHHYFAQEGIFQRILSKLLMYGEVKMIERDMQIWNSKKFLKNPFILKNEKSIVKYRKWFEQFYSSNSPTVESLRNGLDW